MADENRHLTDAELGDTAKRAREIAAETRGTADAPGDAAAPVDDDVAREVYDDTTGVLERSQRIRAADDARTDERQEELARLEADAAEQLRRNAEALRRTGDDLAETRERVRRVAADTRELAADARATREDTSRVADAVRTTPPVVEPPAGGE
ncbi:MAG: hypothetical protein ABR499_16650 [Gemmatimonadaceae bacterium]